MTTTKPPLRVFITGTAGFIGFHLAKLLLAEGFRVHGYDGMTDYYDVTLKQRRHAILLQNEGFSATEAMLEDADTLTFVDGLVEGEPTFPLTNLDVGRLEAMFRGEVIQGARLGTMANAQTHCLQLPHTYLFAHLARGGTAGDADLESFAERLLPGVGEVVARGWQAIAGGERIDTAAESVRSNLTSILGREAAYSGMEITWDMIMNSKQDLQPKEFGYKRKMDVPPRPVPGQYKFI